MGYWKLKDSTNESLFSLDKMPVLIIRDEKTNRNDNFLPIRDYPNVIKVKKKIYSKFIYKSSILENINSYSEPSFPPIKPSKKENDFSIFPVMDPFLMPMISIISMI